MLVLELSNTILILEKRYENTLIFQVFKNGSPELLDDSTDVDRSSIFYQSFVTRCNLGLHFFTCYTSFLIFFMLPLIVK